MKVSVKKGDCQSPVGGIVVMLLFMAFAVGILAKFYHDLGGDYSTGNLMTVFSDFGMPVLFALFFLVIAGYFFLLIFKQPKKYKARMTAKRQEEYEGETVTYMEFEVEKPQKKVSNLQTLYKCYTTEYVPFQVGSFYAVGIKEFNWEIMSVDSWDGESAQQRMGTVSMKPVIGGLIFIFGGGILFSVIHLIYQFKRQENYMVSLIPITILLLFSAQIYRLAKTWKKDNTIEKKAAVGRGPDKGHESLPANMTTPDTFEVITAGFDSIGTRMKYEIKDGNGQSILKIFSDPFMPNVRLVKDVYGKQVAEFELEILDATNCCTFTMDGEAPFSVRRKAVMGTEFEVLGLDYQLHGDYSAEQIELCSLEGEKIAQMSRAAYGDSVLQRLAMNVKVLPEHENNIYIMLISIYMTMQSGELRTRHMRE